MMKNLDDETFDDFTNPKSKNVSNNVEAQPHPEISHEPKKWKEYFLEFLMIFLAVTLGFVAENLRDDLKDRTKETQYIESFVHNLRDDTVSLRHVIESDRHQ